MMTNATRCDQCQQVATNPLDPDDMPYGWFELTSNRVLRQMGEPKEYHFCSWQCLTTFASEQAVKHASKQDPVDATR